MSLQNSIGYFYLFHIRKVNRKLLKCISCRYDYELQANHYGNQIKWQNYLQLRLFIHTTRHFGRPWKLSHLFLRWSKTIFLHSRICFSCEQWKLHEVLHLIVSTASEHRVRIRIDHSSDSGYLLFFDIFESVRLYLETQDDSEGIHPTEGNSTSYESESLKIFTLSFQRPSWLTEIYPNCEHWCITKNAQDILRTFI